MGNTSDLRITKVQYINRPKLLCFKHPTLNKLIKNISTKSGELNNLLLIIYRLKR